MINNTYYITHNYFKLLNYVLKSEKTLHNYFKKDINSKYKTSWTQQHFYPHDFIIKTSEYVSLVSSALSFWEHKSYNSPRGCQTVTCEPCRHDFTSFLLPETSRSTYILANKHTWIIHAVLLHQSGSSLHQRCRLYSADKYT